MSWIGVLFKDIESFFLSPKARAVETEIASLLPIAMQIVQEINTLAPNRTLTEINSIATKYALTTVQTISSNPTQVGNTLLNLATSILATKVSGTTMSTLNTVIQLAVTAFKTQLV